MATREQEFEDRKQSSFIKRAQSDFTTVAWVLIPVAVGINVIGGTLTNVLRIPLYLDMIERFCSLCSRARTSPLSAAY